MARPKLGCARPVGATVTTAPQNENENTQVMKEEVNMAVVQVGKKAPDFEAPAYHKGEFVDIKLSDYAGKWVLLCFYPGDFTFV